MHKRLRVVALLASAMLITPMSVQAKTWGEVVDDGCENIAKDIVINGLEDVGGKLIEPVDSFVIEPIVEFVTTPTETAAKALILKLMENGFKFALSKAGSAAGTVIFDGTRLVVGGTAVAVERVIDEAVRQQTQAQVDGAVSFGNPYSRVSFWDYSGVVKHSPPITRDNIGETVATEGELRTLWYERYGVALQGVFVKDDGVKTMLDNAWPLLRDDWAAKRADFMLGQLARSMVKAAGQASATTCGGGGGGEALGGGGGEGGGPGPYFELINVEDEVAQTVPEWIKSVNDGTITLQAPFGHSECTWNSPPKRVDADGFDLTLNLSVMANKGTNYASTLEAKSGFRVKEGGKTGASAYAIDGKTETDSATMHLEPITFDSLTEKDFVYLMVGGCNAGGITYVYGFRN